MKIDLNKKNQALKFWLDGMTLKEIGLKLDINESTIFSWVKKNNWREKREEVQNRLTEELIENSVLNKKNQLETIKSVQLKTMQRLKGLQPKSFEMAWRIFLESIDIEEKINPGGKDDLYGNTKIKELFDMVFKDEPNNNGGKIETKIESN